MKSFTTTFFFLSLTIISCDSTKKVATQTTSTETTSSRDDKDDTEARQNILFENGFIEATVREMSCGFVLEETSKKKLYYPIQWIEESYKINGKVVYVKFNTPANQNNDCPDAKSIIMEEIKLIR